MSVLQAMRTRCKNDRINNMGTEVPQCKSSREQIGKHVDFLLVIIALFSLAVILVELRLNIDWKAPFQNEVGHFGRKFQVEGDIPTNHMCTDR